MRTYTEHQRVLAMIRDLAAALEGQSRQLAAQARRRAIPPELSDDSPLHATWSHVGSAFQLLVHHAQSLQAELDRLHPATPGGTR